MADNGCLFCKIASGQIPCNKIYEDQDVIAFLDINPASKGHTLVVTKEHFQDFTKTPRDVIGHVYSVAQLISQACIKELKATGVNVMPASLPVSQYFISTSTSFLDTMAMELEFRLNLQYL